MRNTRLVFMGVVILAGILIYRAVKHDEPAPWISGVIVPRYPSQFGDHPGDGAYNNWPQNI